MTVVSSALEVMEDRSISRSSTEEADIPVVVAGVVVVTAPLTAAVKSAAKAGC